MTLICAEKNRLVIAYARATRSVSRAVRKLQGLTGAGFTKALAESETARVECAKARKALLRHKDEHGC